MISGFNFTTSASSYTPFDESKILKPNESSSRLYGNPNPVIDKNPPSVEIEVLYELKMVSTMRMVMFENPIS
jgi:hypothetical protein